MTWLLLTALAIAAPCDRVEMRSLDFWLGRWEVRNAAGRTVAKSSIESLAEGCGVLERYDGEPQTSGQRYIGSGLHTYDITIGRWRQLWTDTRPGTTEMQGRIVDGAVVYEWSITDPKGQRVEKRYTLSRIADGVRQHGERLDTGRWITEFDLRYLKLE
jgi:hypothetical protein